MERAQNATILMEEAARSTEEANREMAECVQAMKEIGDSSTRIANTLKVIDKIAFQTNILALNAAVEAARAGEAGMGFAVVAGEVRILAQQCATASQEIAGLVDQSVSNSDAVRVKFAKLSEAGQKVNQVFTGLKVLVKEISLSSEEQGRRAERSVQTADAGSRGPGRYGGTLRHNGVCINEALPFQGGASSSGVEERESRNGAPSIYTSFLWHLVFNFGQRL
jgi:methyl-accepting chemotaxis protein